jgi:hypothetical protein
MVAAIAANELVYGPGSFGLPVAGFIGQVDVIYGAADVSLNIAGATVGEVRESVRDMLNIPADAVAFLRGVQIANDHVLELGDRLELLKKDGWKGSLDPDELARLERIEQMLAKVESCVELIAKQRVIKEWYTTKEIAERLGKTEFTVREWCRWRRVNAKKLAGGRGNEGEWRISHGELVRIQNYGLLPPPTRY